MRFLRWYLGVLLLAFSPWVLSQRSYKDTSVLSKGDWYKIAVTKEGIYKIDYSFLKKMGVPNNQLITSKIQLFGNGGAEIPESNAAPRIDDLIENAIEVNDGGDGVINAGDYFLFYAPGPDRWQFDVANQHFTHQKNNTQDSCYYFLTFQSVGKRIQTRTLSQQPVINTETYLERIFYERDSINILSSGKQWLGESFNFAKNTLKLNLALEQIKPGTSINFKTRVLGRSINTSSLFQVFANSQSILTIPIRNVTGNLIDNYAEWAEASAFFFSSSPCLLTYNFQTITNTAQAWLDWFEITYTRSLAFGESSQFGFRNLPATAPTQAVKYSISNATPTVQVWEVTNDTEPIKITGSFSNQIFSFSNEGSKLREHWAFKKDECPYPIFCQKIANQNLHQPAFAEYLILTPTQFKSEANRLAEHHRQKNQLNVMVVECEKVYLEFGGGNRSAVALRDFIKMHYDRSISSGSQRLKYVLLFGIGNYDLKGRTGNSKTFVPTYQSHNSTHQLLSYTSDDFFGLLSDQDDIENLNNRDTLDIAIGRLPISRQEEAKRIVDKIILYDSPASYGPWRNNLLVIADDKDNNLFLNGAEQITQSINLINNNYIINKLYVDAFPVERIFNNVSSPAVNQAIIDGFFSGQLILNYGGHGNHQQLSSYPIFSIEQAKQLNNAKKLPLVITATCDFFPFDQPEKLSVAAYLLHGSANGAIGLITTPRPVFATDNNTFNKKLIQRILKLNDSSTPVSSIGDAYLTSKIQTGTTIADKINLRKFTLLGDPAMKLSIPRHRISIDSINGNTLTITNNISTDTISIINGAVRNERGEKISNFNGTAYVKIVGPPKIVYTLANDSSGAIVPFSQQTDHFFNGTVTVRNGEFKCSFFTPNTPSITTGKLKFSVYAENGKEDANGWDTSFYAVPRVVPPTGEDRGPKIDLFLNDFNFQAGGTVGDRPLLLAKLIDSSGINTIQHQNVDHNIKYFIDNDSTHSTILNNFFEANLNSYQSGIVRYQPPPLTKGKHTLTFTAWDNVGNKSSKKIDFFVRENEQFEIINLSCFPNPVTNFATLKFELNKPTELLTVITELFSTQGGLIDRETLSIENPEQQFQLPLHFNFTLYSKSLYYLRVILINKEGTQVYKTLRILKL